MGQPPSHRIDIILCLAVILAFGRVITHDFVTWDDRVLIYGNSSFISPTLHSLSTQWAQPFDQMYIPVTNSAWWAIAWVSRALGGENPGGPPTLNPLLFHTANLVLHAINACLVYRILLRIGRWPSAVACAAALFFAVHPMQTEAVAWATGFKDVFSSTLALLAINQYFAGATLQKYFASTTLFALALLAKPSTVVVPLMLVVIDRWIFQRSWKSIVTRLGPWLVMSVIITVIATKVQPAASLIDVTPIAHRPVVVIDAIGFYLVHLAAPAHLAMDYGRHFESLSIDCIAIPIVLLTLRWMRRRMLWCAAALFLLALLPVSGIVPFKFQFYSTVADRYAYLAMIGVALAVADLLNRFGRSGVIVASAVALALAGRSFVAAGVWSDSESLYRNQIAAEPTVFIGYNNLAELQEVAGDHDAAIDNWRTALHLRLDAHGVLANLIDYLNIRRQHELAAGDTTAAARDQSELVPLVQRLLAIIPGLPPDNRSEYNPSTYQALLAGLSASPSTKTSE